MGQNNAKYYFLSDAHLGCKLVDAPEDHERKLVSWLDMASGDATAIFLLGDIFDFWFEYRYTVPKGFTRLLGKMRELTDRGIAIHFYPGNHDWWTFGYLAEECGLQVHYGPDVVTLCGKRFFLGHGDGLGDKSRGFHFIRTIFHSSVCQWLFRTFVPASVGLRFGYAWSYRNRLKHQSSYPGYLGEQHESLVLFAKEDVKQSGCDYYVFGHRHIELNLMLNKQSQMMILGDFMKLFTYAVYDGELLRMENFEG